MTARRSGPLESELVVERLNRALLGWANYFQFVQANPAYRAVDAHATKRLRQRLCRKHHAKSGKYAHLPDAVPREDQGLTCLAERRESPPWAKA